MRLAGQDIHVNAEGADELKIFAVYQNNICCGTFTQMNAEYCRAMNTRHGPQQQRCHKIARIIALDTKNVPITVGFQEPTVLEDIWFRFENLLSVSVALMCFGCDLCGHFASTYRVPQKYRPKVYGSEGHKNGANHIIFLCMFFSTSGHLV